MRAHLTRYPNDNDVRQIARTLDELPPPGKRIFVVGPLDEPLANVLADEGYEVLGLDVRAYDRGAVEVPEYPQPRYVFRQGDILTEQFVDPFDACVCVSALEHIGLSELGGTQDGGGDRRAAVRVYHALRPGGFFYSTVPVGSEDYTCPHWRRYTLKSWRQCVLGAFCPRLIELWWTSIRGSGPAGLIDLVTYRDSADLSLIAVLERKNG